MDEMNDELTEVQDNDPLSEVQELVWALIDEQATDGEVRRLEDLLLSSDEARQTYVMCMQMHADLHFLFNGKKPQLPEVVEQAIKAEKTKKSKRVSLPALDLPLTAAETSVLP